MAAPLGTVVFKVPELGKVGYDIEQEEAKQLRKNLSVRASCTELEVILPTIKMRTSCK